MYLRKAIFECGFSSLFKLLLFLIKLVFVTSHNTLFSKLRQAFRGETQERGEGHTVHCSVQWDTRDGRGWHQIWREIVRTLSYTFCDRKNAVFLCKNFYLSFSKVFILKKALCTQLFFTKKVPYYATIKVVVA